MSLLQTSEARDEKGDESSKGTSLPCDVSDLWSANVTFFPLVLK